MGGKTVAGQALNLHIPRISLAREHASLRAGVFPWKEPDRALESIRAHVTACKVDQPTQGSKLRSGDIFARKYGPQQLRNFCPPARLVGNLNLAFPNFGLAKRHTQRDHGRSKRNKLFTLSGKRPTKDG